MLLGEPPRTQGDINFSLFGIPVRVHPLFWLVALLLGMNASGVPALLIWIAAVFFSILVHEMGHALVMRVHGYRPWITLYGMGGLASYNPSGSRGPSALSQILISLAGPMAGFLLAAMIIGFAFVMGSIGRLGSDRFIAFLDAMLYISIFWGLINLLPVYPLDGGHIAREIFLFFSPHEGIRRSLILSILTSVVLVVLAASSGQIYIALLFGYMGYSSYQTLQAYTSGPRW